MFDPDRPLPWLNQTVELRPEEADNQRQVMTFSPVHLVRWVQCPRCRRRFWYAVVRDTEPFELQQIGARLRQRLIGEPCDQHPVAEPASG